MKKSTERRSTPAQMHSDYRRAMGILLEVSRNVVGTFDLQKILQETVCGASALFDWGTAAIYLLEDPDHLRLHATYPELPLDFPDDLRIFKREDHPHIERAIRTARPVLIPDTADSVLSDGEMQAVEQRRLRTLYFVPLVSEGDVLGAFIVGTSNQTAEITDEDATLTSALANFAALAIKNARLFQEKNAYTAELERTIAQRDAAEAERKQLQEDLFQVQKLDAIGQLAGGVAHDFNNQLSGILGYAELLSNRLKDETLARFASKIAVLAKRSAELNSRLLIFSRKCQLRTIAVNLNQIIHEVADILRHTISPQIDIQLNLKAAECHTTGDPAQIQSALLNLSINARDAMPRGGALSLATGDGPTLDREKRIGPFVLPPGTYVRVTVADTGEGMSPETIDRMYEPFFTTKREGKGTGMGLAAVFGTLKSHGGAIEVESRLGAGTTFHLFFPLVHPAPSAEGADHAANDTSGLGREVLVIDDEAFNVEITCARLRQAGYVPHGFTTAIAAIDFFRHAHEAIVAVLLDMLMPQKSVSEIFSDLKKIKPDVKVILMSGSVEENEVQELLDAGAVTFLQKPFYHQELIAVLKQIP